MTKLFALKWGKNRRILCVYLIYVLLQFACPNTIIRAKKNLLNAGFFNNLTFIRCSTFRTQQGELSCLVFLRQHA